MLKALELVGFKSFADRTRFEFPNGITTIVGPNGSGKSNIVDAIKWVLGAQSVKSLRGKEMADVIFNGSGTRAGLNAAETTLTLDNASGLLPIDMSEVQITRRVYRSGESEYLINRQPCRLRDIRDLFAGTGAASEAYSIIEQGKVDILLQSSPRDRRATFEEAAGISRFKAKKLESLRRLERVDQNLLRLADIVEEVEGRLRGVQKQASKASRYKQFTDRLQELRTQVGLADWRHLGKELAGHEAELQRLRTSVVEENTRVASCEKESQALEAETTDVGEAIRRCERRISENRERIATCESTAQHERRRQQELEEEFARNWRQLAVMSTRAGDLGQQLEEISEAVQSAEAEHDDFSGRVAESERGVADVGGELESLKKSNEQRRTTYMDQMRSAAALASQVSGCESRVAAADSSRKRHQTRMTDAGAAIDRLDVQLIDEQAALQKSVERATYLGHEFTSAAKWLSHRRRQHARRQHDLNQLRQRCVAATQRQALLEELEERQEGLTTGTKQVLAQANDAVDGPFQHIRGLLANLIEVDIETAPLIEVALGDAAGYIVVGAGHSLTDEMVRESYRLTGRVSFLPMDFEPSSSLVDELDLEGQIGVLGRGDRFVRTADEYKPLISRLLRRTWLVENLETALALAEGIGRGLTFVTLAEERLDASGTLSLGPSHASAGLVSRRSELKVLTSRISTLEGEIAEAQADLSQLDEQIAGDQHHADDLSVKHQQALDALALQRTAVGSLEQQRVQLAEQRLAAESEWNSAQSEHKSALEDLERASGQVVETEAGLARLEAEISKNASRIEELDVDRQIRVREATAGKVRMAKSEERLENLRAQLRRRQEDQQERRTAIGDNHRQMEECRERALQAQRNVLTAESDIAELYLHKERFARETVGLVDRREELRDCRSELAGTIGLIRSEIRLAEEAVHQQDLAANEFRHQRDTLAARLRDDYDIELDQLDDEPTDQERHHRDEVDQEIAELRRKINNIGNVNLDALDELEGLDERFTTLSTQYEDLVNAKKSLELIINKINADSRRLFAETLETVKGHFQGLFRKLFGGGHADIVLEEGVDILESGIEIVARPPGKEPRSISLLSGGEKTLTCVALLLAIFRSRPSPFCVLDEVDAALDEANIDRFILVLQEFLPGTQFIVVTHSKKTMTCANTLYGVTMEESGVSKRVSVRFEDVTEDGEIRVADPETLPEDSKSLPKDSSSGDDDESQAA